jgi:hypothetical protein
MECAVSELSAANHRPMLDVGRLPPGELADLRAWLAARGRTIESLAPHSARLEASFLQTCGGPVGENPRA